MIRRISLALLCAPLLLTQGCGDGSSLGGLLSPSGGELAFAWPPVAGETYPNLELRDLRGEQVKLSDFRGKVLLIEPVGMT